MISEELKKHLIKLNAEGIEYPGMGTYKFSKSFKYDFPDVYKKYKQEIKLIMKNFDEISSVEIKKCLKFFKKKNFHIYFCECPMYIILILM